MAATENADPNEHVGTRDSAAHRVLAEDVSRLMAHAGFDVPELEGPADAPREPDGLYLRITSDGVLVGWRAGADLLGPVVRVRQRRQNGQAGQGRFAGRPASEDLSGIRDGLLAAAGCLLEEGGYTFSHLGDRLLVTGRGVQDPVSPA